MKKKQRIEPASCERCGKMLQIDEEILCTYCYNEINYTTQGNGRKNV